LTCVAKQEGETSGGVQFYVVTIGAKEAFEGSVTQRVCLKLKPAGRTVKVENQNPALRGVRSKRK
jgi:hypothetical protein